MGKDSSTQNVMNRVPLSLALITTFAGLALAYYALVGFGIIQGSTPAERTSNVIRSIKEKRS